MDTRVDKARDWHGVFPAATTQFKADQSLDLPATMKHLDAMIGAGVHGMIVLGTVGENCSLEYREKLEILSTGQDARAHALHPRITRGRAQVDIERLITAQ